MIYERTKGLTGIEGVTAIGWPMHGATRSDRRNDMFNEIVGHSNAPPAAASNLRFLTDHYPVEVPNLDGDWSHFMMHENDYEFNDPVTGMRQSQGFIPAVYSGISGMSVLMGVPIMTPTGRSIRMCVSKEISANVLRLFEPGNDNEKLIPYTFSVTGLKSRYPVRPFMFGGFDEYFMVDLATMSDHAKWQRPAFTSRVLDYFNNKCLVAVEPLGAGINYDDIPEDDVLYSSGKQKYFRSELSGSSAMLAAEVGQNIVAVIELTLNGETLDDIAAAVIYSPANVEGTVTRVSPKEITNTAKEGANVQNYEWSITQDDAILDAYYDKMGAVKARRYSVEHSFVGTRENGKEDDTYWFCKFETVSNVTLDGVSRKYAQIIEHVLDEPDGFDFEDPPSAYPNVIVTNQIYVDNSLYSTDTISSREYDMIIYPPEFITISGKRAPYAGPEARCAQYGIGYAYASQKDYYNPNLYTVVIRKNNSGSCVMFGVVENFWYWPDYPNTKQVSSAVIRSKAGNTTVPAFSDVVEYNDSRYAYPGSTNHAVRRGYIGARLKASVNLVTGAYHAESINNPMISVNWR